MKSLRKTIAIVALTAATAIAPFASAQADSWNADKFGRTNLREQGQQQNNWQRRHHRDGNRYYNGRYYRNNNGVALGVLGGLAAGAIIGGAIANNNSRVVEYGGSIEPWTPAWFRYCDNRYRSFNDNTGTYRGYDGRDHFCVAN